MFPKESACTLACGWLVAACAAFTLGAGAGFLPPPPPPPERKALLCQRRLGRPSCRCLAPARARMRDPTREAREMRSHETDSTTTATNGRGAMRPRAPASGVGGGGARSVDSTDGRRCLVGIPISPEPPAAWRASGDTVSHAPALKAPPPPPPPPPPAAAPDMWWRNQSGKGCLFSSNRRLRSPYNAWLPTCTPRRGESPAPAQRPRAPANVLNLQ